jgi:hypothetical protein
MGARSAILAVLALVAGTALAGAAAAGDGGDKVKGASYSFAASSGGQRAAGSGAFDLATETGGRGRVDLSGRGVRAQAAVRTWNLSLLGGDATLTLRIQVVSSSDPVACRPGTKGTATLHDDAKAGGDRVQIEFAGGRCRSLARSWSASSPAARVKVRIRPVYPRVS